MRFKTKKEFEEEFGSGWRSSNGWGWPSDMDYLFGADEKSNNQGWITSIGMLTDKPLLTDDSMGVSVEFYDKYKDVKGSYVRFVEGPKIAGAVDIGTLKYLNNSLTTPRLVVSDGKIINCSEAYMVVRVSFHKIGGNDTITFHIRDLIKDNGCYKMHQREGEFVILSAEKVKKETTIEPIKESSDWVGKRIEILREQFRGLTFKILSSDFYEPNYYRFGLENVYGRGFMVTAREDEFKVIEEISNKQTRFKIEKEFQEGFISNKEKQRESNFKFYQTKTIYGKQEGECSKISTTDIKVCRGQNKGRVAICK